MEEGRGQVRESPRARVLKGLRQAIRWGRIAPGERIAPEESIAREYSVSRVTVRAALDDLEREGLLVSRKHSGRIVSPSIESKPILSRSFVMATSVNYPDAVSSVTGAVGLIELGVIGASGKAGVYPLMLGESGFCDGSFDRLLEGSPMGIIVSEFFHNNRACLASLDAMKHLGLPVVVYGDSEETSAYHRIISDHEEGSYRLAKLLVERGCGRILRAWSSSSEDIYWLNARNAGYERAMVEAGLPVLPAIYMKSLDERKKNCLENFQARTRTYAGYLVDHLLGTDPVDGIMVISDADCYPAAAACRMCKKEPGKEVLVCGYDNYWRDCWELEFEPSRPLATIDKRNYFIGGRLVSKLLELCDSDKSENPQVPCLEKVAPILVKTEAEYEVS